MPNSRSLKHKIQISGTAGHSDANCMKLKIDAIALKSKALLILNWICDTPSQANIHFCTNDEMVDLNFRFRNKNKPTDVLSFPSVKFQFPNPDTTPAVSALGDIAICVSVCDMQARKRKISLQSELERMLCHGFVHLKGFDHEMSPEAHRIMTALERSIVREFKQQPNTIPWIKTQERNS